LPAGSRILVRIPTWVGDAVMATPALRGLRNRFPGSVIALMGGKHLQPLLSDANLFDEWISVETGSGRVGRNIQKIREGQFDLAILLPHSFRTAWETWRAGVPRRIGMARQWRSLLLTDPLKGPKLAPGRRAYPMHHEYLEVVAAAGVEGDGEGSQLGASDECRERARQRWESLPMDDSRPWVGLHPGAAFGPSKIWPLDRLAEVAQKLREEDGCELIITCGPGEEDLARDLESRISGSVINLADGLWPLDELKVLMEKMSLLITGDTGPRHIAAGMGTPQVVLMGPTSPDYTDAFLETTTVLRKKVECSPCQKKICPLGHHQCMTAIEPPEVLAAARRWLRTSQTR
jgi:heptosyltransferase-2